MSDELDLSQAVLLKGKLDFSELTVVRGPSTFGINYKIQDPRTGHFILHVKQDNAGRRIQGFDIRGSHPEPVFTLNFEKDEGKDKVSAKVTNLVFEALDSFLCEECKTEWGPICQVCANSVGDKLFLMLAELRREQDG